MSDKSSSKSRSDDDIIHTLELQPHNIPKEIIIEYYKSIIAEYNFYEEYKKLIRDKTYNLIALKQVVLASIYLLELTNGSAKEMQHLTNIELRLESCDINPILESQIAYFIYTVSNISFNKRDSSIERLSMYS